MYSNNFFPHVPDKLEKIVKRFDCHGFAVMKQSCQEMKVENSKVDSPVSLDPVDDRCHDCFDPKECQTHVEMWEKIFDRSEYAPDSLIEDAKSKVKRKKSMYTLLTNIKTCVPHHIRGRLWKLLLNSDQIQDQSSFNYNMEVENLHMQLKEVGIQEYTGEDINSFMRQVLVVMEMSCEIAGHSSYKVLHQISLDIERTFPTHQLYMGNSEMAQRGRAALFRIMTIYAKFNEAVGYCQGMGCIGGMLFMLMPEEDAFWCLVSLFQRQKYLMGYFDNDLSKMRRHAQVFSKLLYHQMPALNQHLEKYEIDPLIYLTPWFLSLFTSLPCWETVLRIWDLLLLEGITVIFRVAVSILTVYKDQLLISNDVCQLISSLLHISSQKIHHETFLPVLYSTQVESWEISVLEDVVNEESFLHSMSCKRKHTAEESINKRIKLKENKEPSSVLQKLAKFLNMRKESTTSSPRKDTKLCKSASNKKSSAGKMIGKSLQSLTPIKNVTETSELLSTPITQSNFKEINNESPFSPGKMIGNCASTRHAFKSFNRRTPLRQTQQLSFSAVTFTSPEIELLPIDLSIQKQRRSKTMYSLPIPLQWDEEIGEKCEKSDSL